MKQIKKVIVNGLQKYAGCPVILANQTAPLPPYPYISFTVTTPVESNTKTWSVSQDNTQYKPLNQVWSFTAQSDDFLETQTTVLTAYDWFSQTGHTFLSDSGIIVVKVENITNRDNFLTTEYEYRCGFDIHLSLVHVCKLPQDQSQETINGAPLTYEGV